MIEPVPPYESRHAPLTALAQHRHATAYGALVLDGEYEEASLDGRFACMRGHLVIHPPWHAHGDQFGPGGAVVLNFSLPESPDGLRAACVADVDALERLARDNPVAAAQAAMDEASQSAPLSPAPWLVGYMAALLNEERVETGVLARRMGVSPEHASRICKAWFGTSPSRLRQEGQLRRAITVLRAGGTPSDAVHEAGFCDQPHLTRLLKRMTGLTPARLRCA